MADFIFEQKLLYGPYEPKGAPHCNYLKMLPFFMILMRISQAPDPTISRKQLTNCQRCEWSEGFNFWVNWILYEWICKYHYSLQISSGNVKLLKTMPNWYFLVTIVSISSLEIFVWRSTLTNYNCATSVNKPASTTNPIWNFFI